MNHMSPFSVEKITGNGYNFHELTDEQKSVLSAIAFGDIAQSADVIAKDTRITLYDEQDRREFYERFIESTSIDLVGVGSRNRLFVADESQAKHGNPISVEEL